MQDSSPLKLNWRQFGIVAAMVFLLAAFPVFFALRQPEHLIPLDITPLPKAIIETPMLVVIFPTGEIQVDGRPVDLRTLSDLAEQAKAEKQAIFVDPDECALHDIVTKAVATLQLTGHPAVRLAKPRFPLKFGKADRTGTALPNQNHLLENHGNQAATPALATIIMSPVECGGKANRQPPLPTKPAR